MNKRIWISGLIAFAILGIGSSQYPKLFIATGYGAKCLASGVFVSGRDPEKVIENELNYSIVKYTTSKIDYKEKSVTTTLFGLAKQKAIFTEGFGCYLVDDSSVPLNPVSRKPSVESYGHSSRLPWPEGESKSNRLFSEIDTILLNRAIKKCFDNTSNKNKRTAAIFVAYKGNLIAEQYDRAGGITPDTRLWGWSMNKSIVNAMIGVMVRKGELSTGASAPINEWLKDKRREITINDLLQMSSGLKWNEDYGDVSDATTMLYRERDCFHFAAKSSFEKPTNKEWKYSSGTTNILSGILRSTINNDEKYHNFPYNEIFTKIGMNSMLLETDAHGYFVGSSYGYATARDWAKFGLLYLQDGVWKGDTILPKGWVKYSTTPAEAANGQYGALFWLNRSGKLPDVPRDMFACQGHRGQRVFIIPSCELVLVRLGFAEDNFDFNQFIKDVLNSFRLTK